MVVQDQASDTFPGETAAPGRPKQPRPIRKETWRSFICSFPFDAWLSFSETLQVLVFDVFTQENQFVMSIPLGIGLNAAAVWARKKFQELAYTSPRLISSELVNVFSGVGSDLQTSLLLTTLLLGLISLSNALFIFTVYREYHLFRADLDRLVDSRGVLKSSSLRYVNLSQPEVINDEERRSSSWLMWIWSSIVSVFFQEISAGQATTNVLVISIWNGHIYPLSLNLFCFFSPMHAILYCFSISWDDYLSLAVLHSGLTIQMVLLVWHFKQLLDDQKILSEELHNEYDSQFVYPQTHEIAKMKQRERIRDEYISNVRKKILVLRQNTTLPSVPNNDDSTFEDY